MSIIDLPEALNLVVLVRSQLSRVPLEKYFRCANGPWHEMMIDEVQGFSQCRHFLSFVLTRILFLGCVYVADQSIKKSEWAKITELENLMLVVFQQMLSFT